MPKNKDELPKLLTIKQAAEILNVHVGLLRTSMRKSEKSIGQSRKKLQRKSAN